MSSFLLQSIQLANFRGFEALEVKFDPQLTLFFSENGGGKTALLSAVAISLGMLQRGAPAAAKLSVERDLRRVVVPRAIPVGGGSAIASPYQGREPAGSGALLCRAIIDGQSVEWAELMTTSGHKRSSAWEAGPAMDRLRVPGAMWPLLAAYGTARLARAKRPGRPSRETRDRWDGYRDSLDPAATDGPLLEWLKTQTLGDVQRSRKGERESKWAEMVFAAQMRAAPTIQEMDYDVAEDTVVVRFRDGSVAAWEELSDGYHVYLGLVGDIARRAMLLNEHAATNAIELTPGVVLIDEIDLHLHPRWQRLALGGLRAAFPALQFVVTTHSPQVLSSAKNEQVRWLRDGKVVEGLNVEGRDTNSILRELMGTDERDEEGVKALKTLYAAIDKGELDDARKQVDYLRRRWGPYDTEMMRAEGFLQDAEEDRGS